MFESHLPINDDLLRARKKVSATRPKFVRQESWRYIRLAENWRKPKGVDNKMRKQVSGVPPLVKVGYRGPKRARGLHPSGYRDRLIHNIRDLEKLDPKIDAARIGHSVGRRKRIDIVSKANALGVKVLNRGNAGQVSNQKDQDKEQE
ncbi:MAG: 50S ribosomal protein L32e [Nitrososphaeraceae archaeon]